MKRRSFIKSSALAATLPLLSPTATRADSSALPLIKPQKLSKGDTLGLITPASAVSREAFEKSLENLEALGFRVIYSENMRVRKGFLAGTDSQRLNDLHDMFENPEVKGIVCARGGYGSGRLLPHLNYDLIKGNPKVLVGYSDITALLFGIHAKTGLVCFHGPVGASEFSVFTSRHFEKTLLKEKNKLDIERPNAWKDLEDQAFQPYTLTPGVARGALAGGNLSLLVSLLGTPYDLDYAGKIIFIEDIGESPYRVDRMLTQLLNAGKLQSAAGIALGVFSDCETKPDDPDFSLSLSLREVLEDRIGTLNIPAVYGLPIGHIDDNATLPLGITAELNVEKRCLSLLDSGVAN